jgi:cell division protein FtsB
VAPPVPVTVPRAPFVALVLTMVVAGVLGILVLNTKINENAFRLAQLQSQRTDLDQQEQQLDQQLADLESPNSLAAAACRLGMVAAGQPAYLKLPNGQTVGVPQPASGPQCVTGQQATGTPGR